MGASGTVVILAAGQGTRMRSTLPKVLHPLCGRMMLGYVVDQALSLEPSSVQIVVGKGAEEVERRVRGAFGERPFGFVRQAEQRGTGHAVQCALPSLGGGPALVLYGDMPLLRSETLRKLCDLRARSGAAAALLTSWPDDPRGFGRIVRNSSGESVERIVEERDATPDERAIREVNAGVYSFAPGVLQEFVPSVKDENAQGEFYLTDVAAALVAAGREVLPLVVDDIEETIGVNTLRHLAEARAAIQFRILERHLEAGVQIEDPSTTFVDWNVEIGEGTTIFPCTVIRGPARIGKGCEVGPFTHLRPGTVLADQSEVGNFTETKNAVVGRGTKAKHLSYLGDVDIGTDVNIGAGTIVANYDGKTKHRTLIGDRAFVGSGSILVAPVEVGADATTGGGAVVTRNSKVSPGETWVGVPARPLIRRSEDATLESDSSRSSR